MKLLVSENEIKERAKALGKKITEDYKGESPIFIGILNGCYVFMADLLREVNLDVEIDFVISIRNVELSGIVYPFFESVFMNKESQTRYL